VSHPPLRSFPAKPPGLKSELVVTLSSLKRDVTVHRPLYALGGITAAQTTMSRINHWHTFSR